MTTILAQNAFQPAHTGRTCNAAYPGETWKCFFAEYRRTQPEPEPNLTLTLAQTSTQP